MLTRHVGGRGDLHTSRSVGRSGSGRVSRKTGRGSRVTLQTSCKVCTKLERKKEGKFLAVVYIDSKKKRRNVPEPGYTPIMHLTTVHREGVARSQLGH